MDIILVDQSPLNQRRSGNYTNGFMMRSYNSPSSSWSHLLNNIQGGTATNLGLFGSRPPPYSSLPCFPSSHSAPLPLHQPPLLPLPFSNSSSLPSNIPRTTTTATTVRSKDQHPKKSRSSKKEYRSSVTARSDPPKKEKLATPPAVVTREVEEEEEREEFIESVYSISPPPSSLPLPSFFLARPKVTSASCIAEAVGDGGDGVVVDAGATSDLRRLLRL